MSKIELDYEIDINEQMLAKAISLIVLEAFEKGDDWYEIKEISEEEIKNMIHDCIMYHGTENPIELWNCCTSVINFWEISSENLPKVYKAIEDNFIRYKYLIN
jgi:broad-specificity NMP kinase